MRRSGGYHHRRRTPALSPGLRAPRRNWCAAASTSICAPTPSYWNAHFPSCPVSDRLTLSVHLDGLAATHDRLLGRPGLFNTAIKAIKAAKAQGFRVCTNTSIYKETDPREIEILFSYLGHIGVDGLLVSPAYSFAGVEDGLFMSREEIKDKFTRLTGNGNHFKFFSTPLYLSFLRGEREYECTPWANPTRNPHGLARALLPDRGQPLPYLRGDDGATPIGTATGWAGTPAAPSA